MTIKFNEKERRLKLINEWMPIGITEHDLNHQHSVLWSDSTLSADLKLVKFLLIKNCSYSNFKDEYLEGLERIFTNIQSKTWSAKYLTKNFVFCDYYAKQIKIADITTVLYAQAVEILVMCLKLKAGSNFGEKFSHLFKEIYKDKLKKDIPDLIRIMRNNAAHLAQVDSELSLDNNLKEEHAELVNVWANKYYQGSISRMFHSFSTAFDHVVEDIIFRSLDPNIDQERKYHLSGYKMLSSQFDL